MSQTDVISSEAAGRYAKALFELAEDAKAMKSVEKNLKSLRTMLAGNAGLTSLIQDPIYATEDKVASLTTIAKKAGFHKLVVQFVGLVAQNRRSEELPGIIAAFEDMAARKSGGSIAKVTSATKLSATELKNLKASLKQSLGQVVDVETAVDPDLLGGFVVRMGSRLYDSSLKTKLEDLKIAMKEV